MMLSDLKNHVKIVWEEDIKRSYKTNVITVTDPSDYFARIKQYYAKYEKDIVLVHCDINNGMFMPYAYIYEPTNDGRKYATPTTLSKTKVYKPLKRLFPINAECSAW